MRLFLCMSLALGLMAIASALKCRMCDFRALSICFYGKDVKDCTGNCTHTKATLECQPHGGTLNPHVVKKRGSLKVYVPERSEPQLKRDRKLEQQAGATYKAYCRGTVSLFSTEGCSDKCETSQNKSDNVFRFNYTVSCCSTDECNSGNSVKVSLSLGLGIGLLWLLNAV